MNTIYLVCAIIGGTIMVCQFVMSLLGMGGDHDVGGSHDFDAGHSFDAGHHDLASGHHDVGHHDTHHGHHGSSWFLGVLSFRTVVAALTFFGLAALSIPQDVGHLPRLGVGIAAGVGAMFLVAYIMQFLYRLQADGTARIDRAVGSVGTVYLTIPGQKSGLGKVTVNVQNRTAEYNASTAKDALPTGSKVLIVGVINPDTVEVAPVGAVAETAVPA